MAYWFYCHIKFLQNALKKLIYKGAPAVGSATRLLHSSEAKEYVKKREALRTQKKNLEKSNLKIFQTV